MASTIHSLPVELLVATLQSVMHITGKYAWHKERTTIALLSRAFKSLVYDTPRLWTTLYISPKSSIAPTKLAIIQSNNNPLEVELDLRYVNIPPQTLETIAECFQAACLELHRWRTAILTFGNDNELIQLLTSPAPLLENLEIRSRYGDYETGPAMNLFGGSADRLSHLTVLETCIRWDTGYHGLHSLELRDIKYDDELSVKDVAPVLVASPQLVSLVLYNVDFSSTLPPPFPIHLSQLLRLMVDMVDAPVVRYLLENIRPSGCQHVEITYHLDGDNDPTSFVPLIGPFIYPVEPYSGDCDIIILADSISYHVRCPQRYRLRLDLYGHPIITILPLLLSTFPSSVLRLQTTLDWVEVIDPASIEALLMVEAAVRITTLYLLLSPQNEGPLLELLGQPKEVNGGATRWLFPELQDLDIKVQNVTPGVLSRLIQARYGPAPLPGDGGIDAEVEGVGGQAVDRPALLYSMRIRGPVDKTDLEVAQTLFEDILETDEDEDI